MKSNITGIKKNEDFTFPQNFKNKFRCEKLIKTAGRDIEN